MSEGLDSAAVLAAVIKNAVASSGDPSGNSSAQYNEETGLYECTVCHAPVQARLDLLGEEHIVPCMCLCEVKKREDELWRRELSLRDKRRRTCFKGDEKLMNSTFEHDDSPDAVLSKVARRYAEKFSRGSDWLLISGSNGTGKSFYAACVCNALIDAGHTARFIRISDVERLLWDAEDKDMVYRQLGWYDLLVIDDLGEARSSEYMNEITFTVIDDRLRSGKPCIVTTNLRWSDMDSAADPALRKIYSRLCERAVPIKHSGEDRRKRAIIRGDYKDKLKSLLE